MRRCAVSRCLLLSAVNGNTADTPEPLAVLVFSGGFSSFVSDARAPTASLFTSDIFFFCMKWHTESKQIKQTKQTL
jgi:hypothetical protein